MYHDGLAGSVRFQTPLGSLDRTKEGTFQVVEGKSFGSSATILGIGRWLLHDLKPSSTEPI